MYLVLVFGTEIWIRNRDSELGFEVGIGVWIPDWKSGFGFMIKIP